MNVVFHGFIRLYARVRWIGKSGKSVTKFPYGLFGSLEREESRGEESSGEESREE